MGRVAGDMRRLVNRELARKKGRKERVSEVEQVRRFLGGEERWRLDDGEISAQEYQRYVDTMLKKVKEMQRNGTIIR